jgi:hypothetical protein
LEYYSFVETVFFTRQTEKKASLDKLITIQSGLSLEQKKVIFQLA